MLYTFNITWASLKKRFDDFKNILRNDRLFKRIKPLLERPIQSTNHHSTLLSTVLYVMDCKIATKPIRCLCYCWFRIVCFKLSNLGNFCEVQLLCKPHDNLVFKNGINVLFTLISFVYCLLWISFSSVVWFKGKRGVC